MLSRLRDGRSIRTVSALLLQLVQTSAHDVRIQAKKIDKSRQNKFALRRQESFSESQPTAPEPFLDEIDQEVCTELSKRIQDGLKFFQRNFVYMVLVWSRPLRRLKLSSSF